MLFVALCGSGGVASVLAGVEEPFSGRFWLVMAIGLVVGDMVGAGMGLLLRRSLGWRSSAWAARRQELSWRDRWRIGWASERARAVDDPVLAQAAVERSEFGLRAMARLGEWFLLGARVAACGVLLMAAGLLMLAVYGWDGGTGEDWSLIGIALGVALLALAFPWLHRRLWRWATRRAQRTLAANRAVAARHGAGTADDGVSGEGLTPEPEKR